MANSSQSCSNGTATTTRHLLTHELNKLGDFALFEESDKKCKIIEQLLSKVIEEKNKLQVKFDQRNQLSEQLKQMRSNLSATNEKENKPNEPSPADPTAPNTKLQAEARRRFKDLLTRWKIARQTIKLAEQQVSAWPVNTEPHGNCARPADTRRRRSSSQFNQSRRLSSIMRDLSERFDNSLEQRNSSLLDTDPAAERVCKQLGDYDNKVDCLLDTFRRMESELDERFLGEPENEAKFKALQSVFPLLPLGPILVRPLTWPPAYANGLDT